MQLTEKYIKKKIEKQTHQQYITPELQLVLTKQEIEK